MKLKIPLLTILLTAIIISAYANPIPLVVRADQSKTTIQSTMWGIFFEDINMAADGGIYAELVKNRSFEFTKPLMGWRILKPDTTTGVLIVNQTSINPNNPRYARITLAEGESSFGLANEGFRGMGIKKGMNYHFSVLARQLENNSLKMRIELKNQKNETIATASLVPNSKEWKKQSVSFTANADEPKAKLNIWFEGNGRLDLDMISLFPNDTWKNRPGGLRADLVQLLADLKPGFVRFPGGCIVEGYELATRYQWKKSVGEVENRPLNQNRWNTEFKHRLTPDYFQTYGLGFFEYFLLSEDIGAEPLPIISCGLACQFNSAEAVPMDELDPYIQDALDLIEFANGDATTTWGKIRTQMGHPAPFNMKYIGVGNEQWGVQFIERYKVFAEKIKTKYPNITIVSGTGPSPDGKFFEYAAAELKKLKADIVDEHYYANPEWFLKNATRYDKYDRNSYKIFAGEYAAQSVGVCSPDNKNNWECALSEAAFMTGLERNADVVNLCSYAPLFAHVDGWQWTPDLIWFDNVRSFGTANYYVQKSFSNNKGTNVVPILRDNEIIAGKDGLYASSVVDTVNGELIIKIVNAGKSKLDLDISVKGLKIDEKSMKCEVMQSTDIKLYNTLDEPTKISPKAIEVKADGKKIILNADGNSFYVVRGKILK